MKGFFKAFAVAFGMYSKIPMPAFEWAGEDMKYHLCFFPFVGGLIGLVEFLWYQFCWKLNLFSSLAFFVLCIGVLIPFFVTGGFHVDGFMDTMDALHSWGSREKKLEILKDPHVGSFSVISFAVFMLILLGFGSVLVYVPGRAGIITVCFSFVICRALSGLSIMVFPKAKKDGMAVVESCSSGRNISGRKIVVTVLLAELVISAFFCVWLTAGESFCAIAGLSGIFLAFAYYFFMSRKQFGGINGDLAGFFVCTGEACCAVCVAVCLMAEEIWIL